MRRSLGVLFVAVAALMAAPSAIAASPKLDLVDEPGDSLGGLASLDIVAVSFEVKKVKPRDPGPSLVITMTLAAAPETKAAKYMVLGQIPDCGTFQADFSPGTVFSTVAGTSPTTFFIGCGDNSTTGTAVLIDVRTDVKGPVITWAIAVDSLPKDVRKGAKITSIRGITSFAEPVTGIYGNGNTDTGGLIEGVPNDEVRTDKEFTFV